MKNFPPNIRNILLPLICSIVNLWAWSFENGYPIIIDIKTTSDWTEFDFRNIDFYYLDDTLFIGNEDKNGVKFELLKVIKTPFDSSLLQCQFQILIPQKLPDTIVFTIKKGAIGKTEVQFLTNDKSKTLISLAALEQEKSFTLSKKIFRHHQLPINPVPQKTRKYKPLVLAFYYPWYGDTGNKWLANDSQIVTHKPLLRFYSSSDVNILRQHIDMAKQAGIDGFIVSWWGINSLSDINLKKMIPICESLGFKFTLYLERTKSKEDLSKSLSYIDTVYTRSSSYIKLDDSPVLFIFARVLEQLPLDSITAVKSKFSLINYVFAKSNLQDFEGFHEYLPIDYDLWTIRRRYLIASQMANNENKLMAATVMPGYDDRRFRKPGTYISRQNGEYYEKVWEAALACKPDWILITSFNEWYEGTEIEPSLEDGYYYIKITGQYSKLFKKTAYQQ